MDRETEWQLIEACKQYKADKTTTLGDQEHQVDVSRYLCEQRFDKENDKLFKRLPSLLLHASELAEPDSFQSVDTPLGSLIASRDSAGQVRVFRNSCRHRGAKLVEGKGCSKRMVCPYHAWSYTTDGKLSNVPGQSHCFPSLDKDSNGLITVPSIEKHGFIWLCPGADNDEQAETFLDTHLGDMASLLEWLNPAQFALYQRTSQIWNGNWKLFAEGGLETYHFAFAHRQTIAPYFYNNTAVIDAISKHFRVVMPTRQLEADEVTSLHDCSHTLFFLLPNAALLIQKNHVDWIQFRALAVDKTEIAVTSLIPGDADISDPVQDKHWQRNHAITNETLNEDWELGASIQASLSSGALPYIQYGKNEWALKAFNDTLDELLARD